MDILEVIKLTASLLLIVTKSLLVSSLFLKKQTNTQTNKNSVIAAL